MTAKIKNLCSRWLRSLLCLSLFGGVQIAWSQSAQTEDGWSLLSRYLYRDAAEAFAQSNDSDGRRRDLGLAASLLNEPPVTSGKIERAEKLLRGVITDGSEDQTSLYARYLVARILHMHRAASVPEIEAAYRAVIAADPSGGIGQLAASHLALVLLYQRPDLEIPERLSEAQALQSVAVGPTLPEVAVGYYRLLADASLFYEMTTPQVLEWLRKAHEIGSSDQLIQIGLNLQIAEVARSVGQREVALQYYHEFLATAVATDQRYYTAKMRMQQLEETK